MLLVQYLLSMGFPTVRSMLTVKRVGPHSRHDHGSMTSYDVSEDDKNLATLSVIWTRVGEENVLDTWAGDFGDLLTVHSTSESWVHTRPHQSSHKLGATTFVGTCIGEF